MTAPNEQTLLKRAKSYDTEALGLIYDLYSPALYRYAYRLLGDENMSEDCVAETFSRFLNVLQNNQGPEKYLKAYLYRIAHNWITDSYRRQAPVMVEMDETIPDLELVKPDFQVDKRIEKQQIRLALRTLTPDQRQVIILKFLEGWQNEEVAAALEKPLGAVKALQHRALETLRLYLVKQENGSTL